MLQALAAGYVREREQEMVDVVVVRGVKRIGFAHQVAQFRQRRRAQV